MQQDSFVEIRLESSANDTSSAALIFTITTLPRLGEVFHAALLSGMRKQGGLIAQPSTSVPLGYVFFRPDVESPPAFDYDFFEYTAGNPVTGEVSAPARISITLQFFYDMPYLGVPFKLSSTFPTAAGNCLNFDGHDDFASSSIVDKFPQGAATFWFWIKSNTQVPGQTVFSYFGDQNTGRDFEVFDTSNLQLNRLSDSTGPTGVNVADRMWHHVAITWEFATGTVRFYVDGDLAKETVLLKSQNLPSRSGTLVLGQRVGCNLVTPNSQRISKWSTDLSQKFQFLDRMSGTYEGTISQKHKRIALNKMSAMNAPGPDSYPQQSRGETIDYFGCSCNGGCFDSQFALAARLDEFRIYDRIKALSEIRAEAGFALNCHSCKSAVGCPPCSTVRPLARWDSLVVHYDFDVFDVDANNGGWVAFVPDQPKQGSYALQTLSPLVLGGGRRREAPMLIVSYAPVIGSLLSNYLVPSTENYFKMQFFATIRRNSSAVYRAVILTSKLPNKKILLTQNCQDPVDTDFTNSGFYIDMDVLRSENEPPLRCLFFQPSISLNLADATDNLQIWLQNDARATGDSDPRIITDVFFWWQTLPVPVDMTLTASEQIPFVFRLEVTELDGAPFSVTLLNAPSKGSLYALLEVECSSDLLLYGGCRSDPSLPFPFCPDISTNGWTAPGRPAFTLVGNMTVFNTGPNCTWSANTTCSMLPYTAAILSGDFQALSRLQRNNVPCDSAAVEIAAGLPGYSGILQSIIANCTWNDRALYMAAKNGNTQSLSVLFIDKVRLKTKYSPLRPDAQYCVIPSAPLSVATPQLLHDTEATLMYIAAFRSAGSAAASFQYTVSRSTGTPSTRTAKVTFNVVGGNNAPSAQSQFVPLPAEDSSSEISLCGTDPDGDGLEAYIVDFPKHGTLFNLAPDPAEYMLTLVSNSSVNTIIDPNFVQTSSRIFQYSYRIRENRQNFTVNATLITYGHLHAPVYGEFAKFPLGLCGPRLTLNRTQELLQQKISNNVTTVPPPKTTVRTTVARTTTPALLGRTQSTIPTTVPKTTPPLTTDIYFRYGNPFPSANQAGQFVANPAAPIKLNRTGGLLLGPKVQQLGGDEILQWPEAVVNCSRSSAGAVVENDVVTPWKGRLWYPPVVCTFLGIHFFPRYFLGLGGSTNQPSGLQRHDSPQLHAAGCHVRHLGQQIQSRFLCIVRLQGNKCGQTALQRCVENHGCADLVAASSRHSNANSLSHRLVLCHSIS